MRNLWLKRAIRAVTKRPFGAGRASGGYAISGDSLIDSTETGLSLDDSFTLVVLDAELEITDGGLAVEEQAFGFDAYDTLQADERLEVRDNLFTLVRTSSVSTLEGDKVELADSFEMAVLDAELSLTDAEAMELDDQGPTIESTAVNNTITDANDLILDDMGATLWQSGAALEILNGDFGDSYLYGGLWKLTLPEDWRTYTWYYDSTTTPDTATQTLDSLAPDLSCEGGVCKLYVQTLWTNGMDTIWQGAGIRQGAQENPALVIEDGVDYSLGLKHQSWAADISLKLAVRIIDSRGYVWDDTAGSWSAVATTISSLLSPGVNWATAAITFTGAADGPVTIEIHAAQTLTGYTGGLRYMSIDDVTLVEV